MSRSLLLAAAAGLALSQIAAQQKAAPANITGAWAFQTEKYAGGCQMSGTMMITADPHGRHLCTFIAREQCPDIVATAKESCIAERDGGKLKITSKVGSVQPSVVYDPDNFELTIDNGSHMSGMMRSFNSAPVEFFRGDARVS
jgi:hypothetical protein